MVLLSLLCTGNFNSETPDFDFPDFTRFSFCPSKIFIRTMLNFNQSYVYSNSMIFWNLILHFSGTENENLGDFRINLSTSENTKKH